MSRAKDFMKVVEQVAEAPELGDLKAVLDEFDYGLSAELDHNASNLSTGPDATTVFELSSDQGSNWIELQLWDKNRFADSIGSVRYVCGMKADGDSITLSSGKGIEKVKFSSKDEEIEKIPDIKEKEDYKDKIQRIRRIFLGFQLNTTGISGVPNDSNSFESIGRRVGQGLIKSCVQYLK
jgi:hypothetical protein